MESNPDFNLTCPIPIENYPQVLLAHGGGGRLMNQLIEQMFRPAFGTSSDIPHDATTLTLTGKKIAMTTDSYVVNPLFFPGGDIGSMAIYGTVNDLAMAGARPLYLSVGFILEEGLPMTTLWHIIQAMQMAAKWANIQIVTGDTKVVDRGKGDGIFINTAGIGIIEHELRISPESVQPGDIILVSGDLGRHGIAIMAVREGLEFETTIESDSAPVADLVLELLNAGVEVHCLRDLTRGGLASALHEIATASNLQMEIEENKLPIREDVQGACEILGFDPIYVANEGRFVAFIPAKDVDKTCSILTAKNSQASVIGKVQDKAGGLVTMVSKIGSSRIVDLLSGEQLPRIC
ncbi:MULTISPECIES: hydrogenase expression/formation protein HypE [Limnospira]|uniref:Hydrogenase expression/formation protein HypE n=1 Tax=Limnospira platensis NIES-46 TaxID=1236695 RepID=A0A5M3T4Y8_LIMPL|nr:hydrogenase expression/formation protein HypE [Arthrospira platensis]KDR54928.1 hydrogenase [Arthrospira platensis str. Paraca]MDF2208605.1 hydrogenase expression/formation protein HypE [Arthrospira platensis NCB002]MDT9310151.1 hydrogenase expression/formation protein HypE [Limnospira sp. Paracas R14]BAI94122.1 hydrogenase expression/formation protein HypE [Arthrospira platensis NIES-39]BDT16318.1 hydrogenase expression/formation protein HypE [Arthrospira platensis NIES-39]